MRVGAIALLVCLSIAVASGVFAQEQTIITNGITQIAEELCKNDGGLFYFPDGLGWQVYSIGYWQPMWIDFSEYPSLQELKSDATSSNNRCVLGVPLYGAQPLHVTVTLDLLSGDLALSPGCSSEELTSVAAPNDYQAWQWPVNCRVVERLWEQWQTVQKDLDWKEWYSSDAKPFLTFHFQLADLREKQVYEDNVRTEELAWEEAQATVNKGQAGMLTAMSESEGGDMMLMEGGDLCVITTEAAEFTVDEVSPIIFVQDCQHAITSVQQVPMGMRLSVAGPLGNTYNVETNDALGSSGWSIMTQLVASSSTTVWTDATASAVSKKFYRVSNAEGICVTIVTPSAATISGVTTVTVSSASASLGTADSVILMVDSNDFASASGGDASFPLPTGLLSNGVHQLQARAVWPSPSGDVAPEALSALVTVNVTNTISLQWFSVFADDLPIKASFANPTNWLAEVLDASGATIWSTNGTGSVVDALWSSGSAVADTQYLVRVSIPQQGFAPTAATTPSQEMFAAWKEAPWSMGPTLLTRQTVSGLNQGNLMDNELHNIAVDIADTGRPTIANSDTPYIIANAAGWTFVLDNLRGNGYDRATQWHHIGHSHGPNTLGVKDISDGSSITASNVAALFKNTMTFDPTLGLWVQKFKTPMKFVSIMACDAGNGDWVNAFGGLKIIYSYSTLHLRRRGFLGFSKYVGVSSLIFFPSKYDRFIQHFYANWTSGQTFGQAVLNAELQDNVLAQDVVLYGDASMVWVD
jgi:hypothetical protein